MTTIAQPEIDWSTFPESDGEPMADTEANQIQMIDLIFALRHLLEPRGNIHVGGNQLMYYNPLHGRDHISPDVYVALNVAPGRRATWQTWVEGKFPDVVFEINSRSTSGNDLGDKVRTYWQLGVREYYLYDPERVLTPEFRGYHRGAFGFEPASHLPSGGIFSETLGIELRVIGEFLRVIDPATGWPYPVADEERAARIAAELRANQAKERERLAEERARQAEERAARAEAALRALRAERDRGDEPPERR